MSAKLSDDRFVMVKMLVMVMMVKKVMMISDSDKKL
jgi:hypothetical protein